MPFRTILVAIMLCLAMSVAAQDRIKFISFETGFDVVGSDKTSPTYIRNDADNIKLFDGAYGVNPVGNMHRFYAGAKVEVRSRSTKFGLLSGLRFSNLKSTISSNSSSENFYVLQFQQGTTTQYLTVSQLQQSSSYVGIPVELRYCPFGHHRMISFYFLIGFDFNVRVQTKNNVDFGDPAMNGYQSDVSGLMGKPASTYWTLYGRAGISLGREKEWVNIGITVPGGMSTGASSLLTPDLVTGFQLQIQKKI